jgi:UDP-glucose 4-epimerase
VTCPSKLVLITGASGFLGSRIAHFASEAGWQVRAFDRSPRPPIEGAEKFVGNITDKALLQSACKGAAAVIHAAGLAHVFGSAARDIGAFKSVNEIGTANVVEAAMECGVSHVILASSVAVYGSHPGVNCIETTSCEPCEPYAISKWRGELKAIERVSEERGRLTILRFATIYGEGDRGNVAKLIKALDHGHFVWAGPGTNRKSLIYKDDAARACVSALQQPVPGIEVFNVSAPPATMKNIVSAICCGLGRPEPHLEIPLRVLRGTGAASRRLGDPFRLDQRLQKFIRDDVYNGSKFESAFSFSHTVNLLDGMRREVDFLRAQVRR